jgi:Domain of unknown function (DUF4349)
MDRSDDNALFAELRELRPAPRPEFAAALDQRAAAGFPRGERTSAAAMPFKLLSDWWQERKLPKLRLIPTLSVVFTVLVVATVVVAVSHSGRSSSSLNIDHGDTLSEFAPLPSTSASGAEEGAEAGSVEETSGGGAEKGASANGGGAGATSGPEAGGEFNNSFGAEEAEAEGGAAGAIPEFEVEVPSKTLKAEPFSASVPPLKGRAIERSSYIVLGTKPGEVSGAAAKVYEAVHAAGGYVLNSSVQSGTTGATGATFELSIPSAKVNGALAAISSIAEVRERHDATTDITAPTVSAAEELADSNATIEGLLKQLGEVESEAEGESVEARLREERRQHAAIRASLDHLHQRASMSEVSVRIVTKYGAGVTPPSKDNGDWGVGDALHSAGHILTTAAGVVLIGLAVLAPFALIALLIWAGNRFRIRRLRERTLG